MYHNILNDVGLKWNIHCYVDKTYNRTNVDFFPSIIVWPTIKMTGLRWIYIYLTQTTIVPSLANLALIGNVVKILSVVPNITF